MEVDFCLVLIGHIRCPDDDFAASDPYVLGVQLDQWFRISKDQVPVHDHVTENRGIDVQNELPASWNCHALACLRQCASPVIGIRPKSLEGFLCSFLDAVHAGRSAADDAIDVHVLFRELAFPAEADVEHFVVLVVPPLPVLASVGVRSLPDVGVAQQSTCSFQPADIEGLSLGHIGEPKHESLIVGRERM